MGWRLHVCPDLHGSVWTMRETTLVKLLLAGEVTHTVQVLHPWSIPLELAILLPCLPEADPF